VEVEAALDAQQSQVDVESQQKASLVDEVARRWVPLGLEDARKFVEALQLFLEEVVE
jgi:ribosomal protein L7/L12